MKPEPAPDTPRRPAAEAAPAPAPVRLPWFTADELPLPPPEMRRPPEQEGEPGLFDELDEE